MAFYVLLLYAIRLSSQVLGEVMNAELHLLDKLNYHINDNETFKGRHTNGPEGTFSRNRLLPFGHLIISILRMGKQGLQREMDSFFKETENDQFSIRRITKSGFSRSRRKLAADGTFLNLPNHPSVHEEFGRRGMGRGKKKDFPKSMCLLSALYDPVNYLTLDVQTGPTDGNEQDLLLNHLAKVERGDILLLDRGYPATALFSGLQSKGIHFIVRMREHWLPVKDLGPVVSGTPL